MILTYKYKIIIPQEEPKDVVLGYKTSLDAQMLDKIGLEEPKQDRMYSEEEVRTAILTSFLLGVDRGNYSKELEDKLIEQFKKK
jgi:hypothetical protein